MRAAAGASTARAGERAPWVASTASLATIPAVPHRRHTLAVVAALLPIGWAGCTSTVTPPSQVADPVTVFLLGEAMHTGIVLPPLSPTDEFVEFGFGDWSWFALGNDAWYHAFATVLWPTQGTLGRRTFGARTAAELRARVTWATLSAVEVSGAKAAALRRRLEKEHEDLRKEAVRRPEFGWLFVPYDCSYWFGVTCADVAAAWFRELDCTVGWVPIRGGLAVADP